MVPGSQALDELRYERYEILKCNAKVIILIHIIFFFATKNAVKFKLNETQLS